MSINPVQSVEPAGALFAETPPTTATASPSVARGKSTPPPVSGTPSKAELAPSSDTLVLPEMRQDEVQVQRDASNGEIVIKYLDGHGDVILQVPSAQVLELAHSITNDLEGAAKLHAPQNPESAKE